MPNIEPQSPFYNVMPEANGTQVPNPRKVNAAAADGVFGTTGNTATAPKTSITMGKPGGRLGFLKNKTFLIPLVIVLLAGIGFGVWMFVTANKDEVKPVTTNTNLPEQIGDPDVTTPADWLARYFGAETCTIKTQCGDSADPDRDGLINKGEFESGTDPNNPDSDSDGIADGDEKNIFGSDPLISRTFRDGQYNDADFVKGGFDINTNTQYTPEQLLNIKTKVKELGLHQPTLTTIGPLAFSIYDFKDSETETLESLGVDLSPQAKLDRDTQRQATIKKIGGALLKYKEVKKSYPLTSDFVEMSDLVSTYNTVATNYNDPISKEQYMYGYEATSSGADFTLTYYSETQNQLIKYTAKNAEEAAAKEKSQINNDQRISDLENLQSALIIYSSVNANSNSSQVDVFPTKEQYPNVLVEQRLITTVPKDPNGLPYTYEVTANYDSFTLKAVFENPPKGVTGYVCDKNGCKNY